MRNSVTQLSPLPDDVVTHNFFFTTRNFVEVQKSKIFNEIQYRLILQGSLAKSHLFTGFVPSNAVRLRNFTS